MPTVRQQQALNLMLGKGRNKEKIVKADILREVGYSPAIVDQPSRVFESDGFMQLCDEAGLTDDFLIKALIEDIKLKPQNRKGEIELALKARGRLKEAQQPQGTTNNIIVIENEQLTRIAQRIARRTTDGDTSSEN